jgi:hypothetical protein
MMRRSVCVIGRLLLLEVVLSLTGAKKTLLLAQEDPAQPYGSNHLPASSGSAG